MRQRRGPGIYLLLLQVADGEAQMRHCLDIVCAVADLNLDNEDGLAVMPLAAADASIAVGMGCKRSRGISSGSELIVATSSSFASSAVARSSGCKRASA